MDEMIRATVSSLKSVNASYVVIGGIAASILGRPRMTMDSDIVVLVADEDIGCLVHSLQQHGFTVSGASKPKMLARLRRKLPVKFRYKKHFSLDVRIASYSIDAAAISRSKSSVIFGNALPISSPEDLIVYKLVRFDAIDQMDIKAVLIRRKKKIDLPYVESSVHQLASEIGRREISENLRKSLEWLKQELKK